MQRGWPVQMDAASRKRTAMAEMEFTLQELTLALENCRDGLPLPVAQRARLGRVARASEHGFLAERRCARALIDEGDRAQSKEALRTACSTWVENERRLDKLCCAMQWPRQVEPSQERVTCCMLAKVASGVGKRPRLLIEILHAVEQSQPWSQSMAEKMKELALRLTPACSDVRVG